MVSATERAMRMAQLVRLRRDLRQLAEVRVADVHRRSAALNAERTLVLERLQDIGGWAASSYLKRLRQLELELTGLAGLRKDVEAALQLAHREADIVKRFHVDLRKEADREREREDLLEIIEQSSRGRAAGLN
jgi:hypothetical protein